MSAVIGEKDGVMDHITFERWRYVGGNISAKGMSEEDARGFVAKLGGRVEHSFVTAFTDGSELLGAWQPDPVKADVGPLTWSDVAPSFDDGT